MKKIVLFLLFSLPILLLAKTRLLNNPTIGKGVPPVDTIHIVGHAHMDMNWQWTYFDSKKMCIDNLRQTVAFMDEFPDFTMAQSQAVVYDFVEKDDPLLFRKVRKYVKEGRLELVGGMWTEGDLNMSSGEGISRSFLLGQRYFQSRFGKMAKVGWLPDNFGHTSQMPQILKLSGCDYYYFTRCRPYLGTYWWTGPDASTVLCYSNDSYNGGIDINLKNELKTVTPDKHRLFQPTGVGDHGGGPTRANIEMIHKLDTTKGYPAVKFTTVSDFFRKASTEMNGRPTFRGEMQFIFEGCYTSISDIKAGNRDSEVSLYENEFFNTLSWLKGRPYPANEIRDLWTTVTFNQFHDILCGTGIHDANKDGIARYSEVIRKSTELRNKAFLQMADEVNYKKGMGQPVVAYNFHPYGRKTIVEADVYSYEFPNTAQPKGYGNTHYHDVIVPVDKGQGPSASVLVRDGSGKTYPAQFIGGKMTPPGYSSKVCFVADSLPACGYKTFYVEVGKPGEDNKIIPFNDNTFETDFFTVKVDMKTGCIVSLFDKRTKTECVRPGAQLNRLKVYLEEKSADAWTINKFIREEEPKMESVEVLENGPVRACIQSVWTWGKSNIIEWTYIYRSYPRIDYVTEVNWLETSDAAREAPLLKTTFPLAINNPTFNCQVPFDVVEREVEGSGKLAPVPYRYMYDTTKVTIDGQEVSAQRWVDLTDGKTGVALLNKTKYGHSYHNGELSLTLMRTPGVPDAYPSLGSFTTQYALYPHSGDWKNEVWREGDDYNVPVYASEPPSLSLTKEHATSPEEESFISIDQKNVIMSGIKQSEDGTGMILRMAEVEGKETITNLSLPFTVKSVRRLNLIEFPLEGVAVPELKGKNLLVKIKPHEVVTLGIKFTK